MNTIAIGKKHILLAAVFVAAVISFLGEWTPAEYFSFVSYSYFLMALYSIRCYLFCVLTIGFLALCKKQVSFIMEFAIFLPAIIGGIFILCGFSFNTMMTYSRIVTVLQIATVIFLYGKVMISSYSKHSTGDKNIASESQQTQNTSPKSQDIAFPPQTTLPQQNTASLSQIAAVQSKTSRPDFSKLSRREKEVAELILEGKKNDEIAETLFISAATVKSHIQHIFEKYEARNRMEFANKVREDGNQKD